MSMPRSAPRDVTVAVGHPLRRIQSAQANSASSHVLMRAGPRRHTAEILLVGGRVVAWSFGVQTDHRLAASQVAEREMREGDRPRVAGLSRLSCWPLATRSHHPLVLGAGDDGLHVLALRCLVEVAQVLTS